MISQKESSINNKTVGFDEYDPQIYAKVQEMQRQYRVARENYNRFARENEWYAHQGQASVEASVADIPYRSLDELVTRVRCLAREVGYLKTIIDTKGLLLDASIEEIYGDKI